ncbi:YkvA family protein [Peribacillus alkalitolerans]|uniref:YkvA family protein n=1 Tax=Peribacillus alkalitolerans TaxID=1550385 RepID=UPI0013D6531D|nr:YkvA family protein [Peribacillus alkalitolerans]
MIMKIKAWARNLKKQVFILYYAYQDDRVPWYAKLFAGLVVAYAFSPIDLIPDFIPILGYIDDVIIVPLGIMFALKMIPDSVITNCEIMAEELMKKGKPKNWIVASIIIMVWVFILLWGINKAYYLIH